MYPDSYKDSTTTEQYVSANRVVPLLVSLFLFLLAFFIMLNALAEQAKQKSAAVEKSVRLVFKPQNPTTPEISLQPTIAPIVKSTTSTTSNLFATTKQIAESSVALIDMQESNDGNRLDLHFMIGAFFEDDAPQIRKSVSAFLVKLVETISVERLGTHVETEIVLPLLPKGDPYKTTVEIQKNDSLSLARTTSLATSLETMGIVRNKLFVAVSENNSPDRFTITFYLNEYAGKVEKPR